MPDEFYYRVEDTAGALPYIRRLRVLRKTPHGVVLNNSGTERFQKEGTRKKYAAKTTAEAVASYRARKARQIKILTKQLETAKRREIAPINFSFMEYTS